MSRFPCVPQAPWVGVGLFSLFFCCRGTTVGLQPGLVSSGVISTMASLQPWLVSSSCSTHAKHTTASLQAGLVLSHAEGTTVSYYYSQLLLLYSQLL